MGLLPLKRKCERYWTAP